MVCFTHLLDLKFAVSRRCPALKYVLLAHKVLASQLKDHKQNSFGADLSAIEQNEGLRHTISICYHLFTSHDFIRFEFKGIF